jgi:hypothetical protein
LELNEPHFGTLSNLLGPSFNCSVSGFMPINAYKITRQGRAQQYILVESSSIGNIPRNAAVPTVRKAAENLADHLAPLSAVAETVRKALFNANHPAEVEMEFGIELGGAAGIPTILAGTTKANFKVTVKWTNETGRKAAS